MVTPIELTVVSVFVIIIGFVLVYRMVHAINPGKLGLAFVLGVYLTTLRPGLNFVSPLAKVQVITAGSGANGALGLTGTALADLDPQGSPGPVQIGDRTLQARAVRQIRTGTLVTVIGDASPGAVLVGVDRRASQSARVR